jgi:two-component system cell cycle sensor histidine kinase/response regulator CckA
MESEGKLRRQVRDMSELDPKELVPEFRRREEAFRAALRNWESFFQAISHPTMILSPNHNILMANRAVLHAFGKTEEELLGKNCYHFCQGAERPPFNCPLKRLIHTGHEETADIEISANGRTRTYLVSCSPIFDGEGRPERVLHIATDITDRKEMEMALRRKDERLSEAERVAHLGHWELNTLTNELTWSDEIYRIFNMDRETFGASYGAFLETVHPEDRERVRRAVESALAGEAPYQIDHRIVWPDGTVRIVQERADVTFDDEGKPIRMLGTVQDITEGRQLQMQLVQAQKMESVGRLAAGVAHDFNNLLSAILGYSELSLKDLPDPHPLREPLEIIQHAGEKAAALTRQLLAFSRKQVMEFQAVDLGEVVGDMAKMLRRIIGEDVVLELRMGALQRKIWADPGQVEQILMNLTVNARDSMPQGGRIIIEASEVTLDESFLQEHPGSKKGPHVCLSFSDTGEGMAPEVLERIFEPFYTTKDVGKGTGLGLAMVYGIVKQHEGYIAVESLAGRGTSFRVYFPMAEPPVPIREMEDATRGRYEGQETLLVVDDDPTLRGLVVDILEPLGYRLMGAADGREALAIGQVSSDRIDLLLTDLMMPSMGGEELSSAFHIIHPETQTLFMTGYMTEPDAGTGRSVASKEPVLQKPITPSKLVEKVRSVLDRPRRGN